MAETDYLIVGQGIAGTLLAYELLSRGQRVMVVDDRQPDSSSYVAAGLFNPVTGKGPVLTWMAGPLFEVLHAYYPRLEALTGARFFFPTPLYMPFDAVDKLNRWTAESVDAAYMPFVEEVSAVPRFPGLVRGEYGGMLLKRSGYVETSVMLSAYRRWLQGQGLLREDVIRHDELRYQPEGITWRDIKAKAVIWCDGVARQRDSPFGYLPFSPVKGEILYIRAEKTPPCILNRGCWVLPTADGLCKVGATYQHQDLNTLPTDKARKDLTGRLEALLQVPYEIVDHKAGIRPATRDRKPFLGAHPELPGCYVFNGLGTKGVSLAPYFARHLAAHLLQGSRLMPEVDVKRV